MFCPKCKSEYREGFNFCADCQIALIEELSNEEFDGYEEFISIAATTNISVIPIAKSILDYAEIKYFIKGNMLQSVPGINNIMEIQVPVEDVQNAKDLLKDLDIK